MFPVLALAVAAANIVLPGTCDYDRSILSLGINAFDQEMSGGWRELAARPGCAGKAADVIRYYRLRQQASIGTLSWHEAQLRADVDQTDAAIALMKAARHDNENDGWNIYVDATISFLRGDYSALVAARQTLFALPMPDTMKDDWVDISGRPIPPPSWPPNLDVIDALIKCFGKNYHDAYRCQR